MPFTGEVDISGILATLGDPDHGLVAARPDEPIDPDEPYRAAYGTIDMSTSVGLAVVPRIVWDVNGYYRSLGIAWPYKPTRRELRQGFLVSGGHRSERLTYYMKQLLDPEIRREYDAMPPGSRFRDKYVLEEDLRKLSNAASKASEEEGILVTVDDLIAEHEANRPKLPELPPSSHIWNWGYYAQKSRKYDTKTLETWQELLTAAFAEQKLETVISIGYIGKTKKAYEIKEHDGRQVFFLGEDTNPTRELAETAVSKYKAQRRKGTT